MMILINDKREVNNYQVNSTLSVARMTSRYHTQNNEIHYFVFKKKITNLGIFVDVLLT